MAREFAVLPGMELGRVCGPMRFYNRYAPLAGEKCQSARCGGRGGSWRLVQFGNVGRALFEEVCLDVSAIARV